MKNQAPKRPTHLAYAVDGEGKDAPWLEIGAVWPHDDGKGFNINLKALPIGNRIVIRERQEKTEKEAGR